MVCDPLDRCNDVDNYPALSDNDAVVTVAQLRDKILNSEFFSGGDQLQVSLPKIMHDRFQKWIEIERLEIDKLAEDHFLKVIRQYGQLNEVKFRDLPKVKFLLGNLKFFEREGLIENMKEAIELYEEFI